MAQAAVGKKNWFVIWVSAAAVVVVAVVIALVVWMNNAASDPGTVPSSSGIDSETGAIVVGTGSNTLDTYIDFMCPICNSFEQTYGDTIVEQIEAGTITLNIHPISILDNYSSGTEYSTRAASAMYCVAEAEPDAALSFMQAMYDNQPDENSTGLTDEEIIEIAEGVGAGAASDCITAGTYMDFVTSLTPDTPLADGATSIGTPTVVLNGTVLTLSGDPQADIVDALQ
ncbi:MAG: thioredoxin domain-containing protein [Microbacterium sp.]